ncbi:carboxyl transferase domain-containing protein [Azospirillum sp.]|uniref:carboxyl transferase domain-containing protein n=1 Tax=Azospirillum sp. TaxID=34012 RepID=UPI002D53B372|nr:carboxyl transferase domain-containing protein [Azospirillum sp.]HYD70081.1 carboxyl transferase domain-containing protein [Azospirillum sp.]
MPFSSLLIANRGEVAVRIARAASEADLRTVAVYAEEDARSLHVRKANTAVALPGRGAAAYLSMDAILAAARDTGCGAVHPGYGFLSENAAFAERCAEAGVRFVGPRPEVLALFGDKVRAKALAAACDVPLAAGTTGPTGLEEARAFLDSLGPGGAVMIKAVAGGGGRGMRIVRGPAELEEAYERCSSEALAAFGNAEVYVEQLVADARHIEVQVAGDGTGRVSHLWERECTLQRRHQKLVEVAPSPSLPEELRRAIIGAALRMAEAARYDSLGTFEFLVDGRTGRFIFIEANPRLQVEHTVTEEVTGVDLVVAQLRLARGATLAEAGIDQPRIPHPAGHAIQLRINLETMDADGRALPAGGTLSAFDIPSGPGVRVDTFAYAGYTTVGSFDSLLAKLIVHSRSPHYADALAKAYHALAEFRIEGTETNVPFLQALLKHPDVVTNRVDTRFVETRIADLLALREPHPRFYFDDAGLPAGWTGPDRADAETVPVGMVALRAPMPGTIVALDVAPGDRVRAGQAVAVIEAMKVEMTVQAATGGIVRRLLAGRGATVAVDAPILLLEPAEADGATAAEAESVDLDAIRPDLAHLLERRALLADAARPDAVAKRHALGGRTARENIADLCDEGSFVEFGGLTTAMQRSRRPLDELLRVAPADGVVTGIGTVNGALFGEAGTRCTVMAYDYTVFAGTQGFMAHRKMDRAVDMAERNRTPFVLFSEGGGGRPGDTDYTGVSALEFTTFSHFARLSGLVPRVGINHGRCFAGNAALLGSCDAIIATRNSSIGMAGPAMIEGGGLGRVTAEEVGPVGVQAPNGVIDIVVEDEAEAVRVAKRYLSYFQGRTRDYACADQRLLRRAVPENRLRVYDVRAVLALLADTDSVLELRSAFGCGMVTALARVEGRPVGVIANVPTHLGGAIDADGADKAARFMQLCDAFGIPLLSLCDTPGFMVGPEAERTATVRHFSRLFVTGASLSVPVFTVILRKAYGLGAQGMTAGHLHSPHFTVAWPTGEMGPMGIEGAVHLAYRRELAAAPEGERKALFDRLVAELYEQGKATNVASFVEIDDVIDPAETRHWLAQALRTLPPDPVPPGTRRRTMIDTW